MTTAIIGIGHIGSALAHHLVAGGEDVALAAEDTSRAEALAMQLGSLARADSVKDAMASADAVIFAVWLDQMKELIAQHEHELGGKVVIDPSNPLRVVRVGENRNFVRTLPDGQSSGSVVAALLPKTAHYVKAFGTLGAASLASAANRGPRRVVLFYATDDDVAATTAERLILAAGFQPLKAGGVAAAIRIETPGGDLHQYEMNGELLDLDQARALLNAKEVLTMSTPQTDGTATQDQGADARAARIRELMLDNLYAVFNQRDPERRLKAIATNYTKDVIWTDPEGTAQGHQAMNELGQKLLGRLPNFVFSAAGPVHVSGDLGLLAFNLGIPEQPPAFSGIDVALVRDGRIALLYTILTAEDRSPSSQQ